MIDVSYECKMIKQFLNDGCILRVLMIEGLELVLQIKAINKKMVLEFLSFLK